MTSFSPLEAILSSFNWSENSRAGQTVLRYEIRPDQIFPQWTRLRSPDKRRGPLPPKYRNPMTGETWCGRGRAPKWMSGSPREAFLIDRPA
ncbi:H-NS histone family protein [Burkholderia pseudomallei]|uniref:H-NS histone family protein n=1 Tax=Burkholderia pseudomallei TaxID=28450 RepID=A0A8A4DWA0_BURPE|nr:H-NS histone family protein [Burkholderia pseudomallei]QWM24236.1 H-NS histone family protein [Burkholderia pseudomallei]QWV52628.1 H-NS histone family protein [Burkholderia pseudomallei]QWV57996.1 H-NS histone family protein [Burkholderia pseudomallei]